MNHFQGYGRSAPFCSAHPILSKKKKKLKQKKWQLFVVIVVDVSAYNVCYVTNEFISTAVVCFGRFCVARARLEENSFWPFASHKFHQTYTDELVYIHCVSLLQLQ